MFCLTEIQLNILLQTVLYLNSSHLQYSSGTVLLTVQLAALKAKSVTELLAATDLALTSDTECKELNC